MPRFFTATTDETQPQVQRALLSLSAIISQYFTVAEFSSFAFHETKRYERVQMTHGLQLFTGLPRIILRYNRQAGRRRSTVVVSNAGSHSGFLQFVGRFPQSQIAPKQESCRAGKLATEASLDDDAALAFSGIVLRGCGYHWIRQFVSRRPIAASRSGPSKHPFLSRHCCCFLLLRLENRAIELSCCFKGRQCRRLAISMSLEEITAHLTTRM